MSKSISMPMDGMATLSYKCRLAKYIRDAKDRADELAAVDPEKADQARRQAQARAAYFKSLFGY